MKPATAKPRSRAAQSDKPDKAVTAPSQRLQDRRRKIIAAAQRLFLRNGYAGTSVNEVVKVAGGSLATLYAEFGTKEKLFEAVLSARARAIFEEGREEPARGTDVAAELRALATRMQARILSIDGLAIYRLAVSEGPRFAALRKAVMQTGLRGFLTYLAEYFSQLADSGRIDIDDPYLAAERFLSLVQGQQLFAACCAGPARIDDAARSRHVRQAVDAFLHIYPPAKRA